MWRAACLAVALGSACLADGFPSRDAVTSVTGELVTADFVHRKGQFRATKTGELVDFALAPYGAVFFLSADADLRDVPLGTSFEFLLTKDKRVALMRDQFTVEGKRDDRTEEQAKKFFAFTKWRGLPGWIDQTAGNKVTVTLFSGDPGNFKKTWMGDFAVGKDAAIAVANDELRTWNPPVDKERATITEIVNVRTDGYGCSGVRLTVQVNNMLEGFRKGRVIRVFGPGWPAKDQFYGESLMGYGFGRMQNQELVENPAKEYPEQFPFRTDYGNAHMSWYRLKPGQEPPPFAEHLVFGELVKVDAEKRAGQFRADRTGEVVDFTLLPEGRVKHLGGEAALVDLSPGTRCRFSMFEDERGAFTKASLVSDEFSYLSQNFITYRIDSLRLAEGKLWVGCQIPEVKNYNGDMERPPDFGRTELRVCEETRVWKGEQQIKLADLAVGDVLLVNVTGEQPGQPSRCTDIWVGAEAHKLVIERAKQRPTTAKK